MYSKYIFCALLLITVQVKSDRILGVFLAPSNSHFNLGFKLMKELAGRGHEVTFICPFPEKEPIENIKFITLSEIHESFKDFKASFFENYDQTTYQQFNNIILNINLLLENILNSTQIQNLLKSNEKFDLVILDAILNEANAIFAHHYDAPLVIFSAIPSEIWISYYTSIPAPDSYVPQFLTGYTENMTFIERMQNTLLTTYMRWLYNFHHFPKQNEIVHKLWPDAPHLSTIIKQRSSLILLNSHPSISVSKPLVPNTIEIGGFHVEDAKSLPKDLKSFMDRSKQGVIFFSMGSNLKSAHFSQETREVFLKVFKDLPYNILWKYEEELKEVPNNVKINKWWPQNDILAHPHLKLVITHGGMLTITEAIYHAVPFIGIPIFGDQKLNMAFFEKLGAGKTIHFNKISYELLKNTIEEIINNKSYRENVRHRSLLLRDQPMKPMDAARYWIEYVLRHKYSPHLKTGAYYLSWYQESMLDVWFVIFFVTFTLLFIIYWSCKKLLICNINNQKKYKKT